MDNNTQIKLVTQVYVKHACVAAFKKKWLHRQFKIIKNFPNHLSQEVKQIRQPMQYNWIITDFFSSVDAAQAWLQSRERLELFESLLSCIVGIDAVDLIESDGSSHQTVTASVSTVLRPQNETDFLKWNMRIAPIQAQFAGFRGYKIVLPNADVNTPWVTVVTFDSDAHLEAWLNSGERKKYVDELQNLIVNMSVDKVYAGFNFWFNQTKNSHVVWKENMLVLLTLYPVVFLLSYIQNPVMAWGVPFWLALFFSNAVSTVILGCITTPWLMRAFSWWIHPPGRYTAFVYTACGTVLVSALYLFFLISFWLMSK